MLHMFTKRKKVSPIPEGSVLYLTASGGSIVDATKRNSLSIVGNTKVNTTITRSGLGSIYFDGTGDYITCPNNDLFAFGTGPFEINFDMYPTSYGSTYGMAILDTRPASTNGSYFVVGLSSTGFLAVAAFSTGVGSIKSNSAIPKNSWSRIRISMDGTTIRMYINDVLQSATLTNTSQVSLLCSTFKIGYSAYSHLVSSYAGYLEDLSIAR